MSKVISALSRLVPVLIASTTTGRVLTWEEFQAEALIPLITWVRTETQRLYDTNPEQVHADASDLKGSANSYSRSCGYAPSYEALPREIKAKSRLAELVHHKLMTETASYERNTDPKKRLHHFSRTVNLGAVDSQMARLSHEENTLTLTWKCWADEYVLNFITPSYILDRTIAKWSLPVVSYQGLIFTVQESPAKVNSKIIAGIDLGRVEPFTMAVLSKNKKLAAEYRAQPQLRATNAKRERLLRDVARIKTKTKAYLTLGVDDSILCQEAQRLRNKASRLSDSLNNQIAADIARKTTKHNVALLHIENLRWVTGPKYGSKWIHGITCDKIEHTSARHGVRVKRVNPRNSSQDCHKCGSRITHNTKTRTVWCNDCKSRLDRDVNAALNIAKNKNKKSYPDDACRRVGGVQSPMGQDAGSTITHPRSQETILTSLLC